MKVKYFSDKTVKTFVVIMGVTFIGFLLKELQHIFIPFVVAYFLFFLFAPMNEFLHGKKIPMPILVILDLVLLIGIIFGTGTFFVDSLIQFSQEIDIYFTKLNSIVRDFSKYIGISDPFFKYFSLQRIIAKMDYKDLAGGMISYTFDLMGSFLFVLFFFVFIEGGHSSIAIAIRKRFIIKREKKAFLKVDEKYSADAKTDEKKGIIQKEKEDIERSLGSTFKKITEQIQKYIITKIAMNLLAGGLVTGVCFVFDVDFPIIWGTFTFLLNFIPTIGSAIALIFPTLMALVQYEALGYGLLIAAIIALIQTMVFNLMEPTIIGKRLNMNPIMILLSVLVWGYIWGIVGMFMAVPLTAIIKIILENSQSKDSVFLADLMSQGQ